MFGISSRRSSRKVLARSNQRQLFRPLVEALEMRAVPAAFAWVGGAQGDFHSAGNWRGPNNIQAVPGPADDANLGGARVTASSSAIVNSVNGGQLEVAGGTFQVNNIAASSASGNFLLDSDATLRVASGTFDVVGAEISGTILVEEFATFTFRRGINDINPGVNLTGSGQYVMTGDALGGPHVVLYTDLQVPENLNLRNGILDGAFDLIVSDHLEWGTGGSGGVTMQGTGKTIVEPGATLHIGGGVHLVGRTIENHGTINYDAPGVMNITNGGTIENLAGATFNMLVNRDIVGSHSGAFDGILNNAGTFVKSGSSGTSMLNMAVNNTGVMRADDGTLVIRGGKSTGGSFVAAADATFKLLGGGTREWQGNIGLQGSGLFVLDGGQQDVSPLGTTLNVASTATLQWTNGNLAIPQGATLRLNGNMELPSDATSVWLQGSGTLDVRGAIVHSGSGNLVLGSSSVPVKVQIPADSVYTFQSDGDIVSNGAAQIHNAGTIRKVAGTDASFILPPLQNTANVASSNGVLALRQASSVAGRFSTGPAGTIQLTDRQDIPFVQSGVLTVAGTGTVRLGPGDLQVAPGGAALAISTSSFHINQNESGITVPAETSLQINGVVNLSGGQNIFDGGGTIIINGELRHSGTGNLAIRNNTTLRIPSVGTYTFLDDAIVNQSNGGRVVNLGVIRKTGGEGTSKIAASLLSSGELVSTVGTLQIRPESATGRLNGGTLSVAEGAIIDLAAGSTVDVSGTITGSGEGEVRLASGSLRVVGGTQAAILDFPANLLRWNGGDINTNGRDLEIRGSVQSTGANNISVVGGGTLRLTGTMSHSNTNSLGIQSGTTLHILSSGNYNLLSDADIASAGSLVIEGTLRKASGTGLSTISGAISNEGRIDVRRGTLSLIGSVSQINAGELTGGRWTIFSTATTPSVLNLGANIQTIGLEARITLNGPNSSLPSISNLELVRGNFELLNGASFTTVGSLTNNGSILLASTATLNVEGNYRQNAGSRFLLQATGSSIGRIRVAGDVTLNGALVVSFSGAQPAINSRLVIVENRGTNAVAGTFAGLPQLGTFTSGGMTFRINYASGAGGNDVVLIRVA